MPSEPEDESWWPYVPDGIPAGPDIEDIRQLVALGGLVRESSMLEMTLRTLYCALLNDKNGAVAAAAQPFSWLIDKCSVQVRRSDLPEAQRAEILGLLNDAHQAMGLRNRFVHDVWVSGHDGSTSIRQSKRKTHTLSSRPVTTDEIAAVVRTITRCSVHISRWLERALPDGLHKESQLRWEDEARRVADNG